MIFAFLFLNACGFKSLKFWKCVCRDKKPNTCPWTLWFVLPLKGDLLIFLFVPLSTVSLATTLIFILPFYLLILDWIYFSFPSFSRWRLRLKLFFPSIIKTLLFGFQLLGIQGLLGFPCGSDGKESAWNIEDVGSIPVLGRFLGEGNGNPLQYSCLENPMERGAWWSTVHGVAKNDWVSNTFFLKVH